ncbi:hypothetical protein DUNSADRAFT_10453 [Dunaliella salina]|uniref:Uncharacterized protein n=1 Tax=Dunaliella salina TaxID=3046 RepID=A0ABQ7GFA6_DUNSA|nr:hypothetical protein DUNSADRAFT_10453 [Dunaliella salina]KAF5833289.1 hypothetical protein DUNSADRAFT_10453 [Dunaliella salina]|eukprot:KAF5833288.1 hypothetical protein DUNSADRAFT_10453 [Dunaliella salina]
MGCASSLAVQHTMESTPKSGIGQHAVPQLQQKHAAPQEQQQEHGMPVAHDQQVAPDERQEHVEPQDRPEHALPANQQQQQHVVPDPGGRHVTECGIRMSWLVSWARTVEQELGPDASTADVCAKLVIPSTRARKCRFVDIMESEHVGPPKYFISHTWSWRFATLVDVLAQRLRGTPDAFVWLGKPHAIGAPVLFVPLCHKCPCASYAL